VTRASVKPFATVPAMDDVDVQIVPLAQPRPLTLQERELLDFLLEGPVDCPELRVQAATAVVNGVCSCGCPSIQLAVNEEAPRARLDGREVLASGGARICAKRITRDRLQTEVILHIVGDVRSGEGVIWEVEVWPTAKGEQRPELPPIDELQLVDP
jgi:hypothetical protein